MPGDRFYTRTSMLLGDAGLKAVGKLNVPIYRATRGMVAGKLGASPVLLLTTLGRRSGERRTAPVLYMRDGVRVVVVGSNAGNARPPAWALNLRANPDAEIQMGGERCAVHARVAEGQERAELWSKINAQYSGFDDYAARTSRDISVFVLDPRSV